MRRLAVATCFVAAVIIFVAGAVFTTLRAEAKGPLGASSAALLDTGSLGALRAALLSTGGTVVSIQRDGVTVHNRTNHLVSVYFVPHAVFLERGMAVEQSAIELGAHITVLGLRGSSSFVATKVLIAPHHHAIGGLIVLNLGGNLLTIVNHHAVMRLVKVPRGTPIMLRGRPTRTPLRPNTHILALAVHDPRQPGLYLADAVRILLPRTSMRVGGIISHIDAAQNRISIYNKTLNRVFTVEVITSTRITLSKWAAGYGDMHLGDHLTVSGTADTGRVNIGPNPIVARRIRISSLNFGGVISAIWPQPKGAVLLIVRARHGHNIHIDAPGRTSVSYAAQSAHVLDLVVGEKIAARGQRVGKFELMASSIRVYPRLHTIGGTVARMLPGLFRIVNPGTGQQYFVHVTLLTSYTLNGKPSAVAAVRVGLHIRVRGFDALHADQKSIPTLIASHVSIVLHTVHHRKATRHSINKLKTRAAQSLSFIPVLQTPQSGQSPLTPPAAKTPQAL